MERWGQGVEVGEAQAKGIPQTGHTHTHTPQRSTPQHATAQRSAAHLDAALALLLDELYLLATRAHHQLHLVRRDLRGGGGGIRGGWAACGARGGLLLLSHLPHPADTRERLPHHTHTHTCTHAHLDLLVRLLFLLLLNQILQRLWQLAALACRCAGPSAGAGEVSRAG